MLLTNYHNLLIGILLFVFLSGCHHPKNITPHNSKPATAEQRSLEFLVSNLPVGDQETIPQSDLVEHVQYSLLAKENAPWGESIPFQTFLHHILPHRFANEPFKPHRKAFYSQLTPLVEDCKSAYEAALIVSIWCSERIEYRPSSFWLAAPTDMLKTGFGRCEELCILFATAARSVGIPVRGCWVPAWRHTNDNHVWVEIWDNGNWIPLDVGTTAVDPNDNWFIKPAQSAPAVYSITYGHPEQATTPTYKNGLGFLTYNLTERYAESAQYTIQCVTPDGTPAPDQPVYLWTYNTNTPILVARGRTDETGTKVFLLGKGTYIATTGNGTSATAAIASAKVPTKLHLNFSLPEEWTWELEHPAPHSPLNVFPTLSKDICTRLENQGQQAKFRLIEAKREAQRTTQEILIHLPNSSQDLIAAIKTPWPSAVRLAAEFKALSPEERTLVAPYIIEMDPKDLALTTLSELAEYARFLTLIFGNSHTSSNGEATSPRIYAEPSTLHFSSLSKQAESLRKENPQMTWQSITEYTASIPTTPSTPYSPKIPLAQALTSSSLTAIDKLTLTAGLARASGIPTRVSTLLEGHEYHINGKWLAAPAPHITPRGFNTSQIEKALSMKPNSSLVLLDNHGNFSTIELSSQDTTTYIPGGILLEVSTSRKSPNLIAGHFRQIPPTALPPLF